MAEKIKTQFTINCGIHLNTPEIQHELEKRGYIYGGCLSENDTCIITNHFHGFYHTFSNDFNNHDFYDCGTNVELFLSLAALQHDSDNDKYQLFKLNNNDIQMCECESHNDMWGDCVDAVKLDVDEIIMYYEPKILVIYVDSAEDTKDLRLVYDDLNSTILYNPTSSEVRKELKVTNANTVIILGHGSPNGLFDKEWKGYSVDSRHVNLLRDKTCIGIWCYASEFAIKYDLKGFFTSMFISNKGEAACYGFNGENEEIYEQTRKFLKDVNQLIKNKTPMNEWIDILNGKADLSIPYVYFNYEALTYLD